MTLLREIQRDAIDGSTELTTLLRKCLVLAARLGHEEFRRWVKLELDGYGADDEVPEYRCLFSQSNGHFVGVGGSQINNTPIPVSSIPEEHRGYVRTVRLSGGVAELEHMLTEAGTTINLAWSPDLIALVRKNFIKHMNLVQAWRIIDPAAVAGVLSTVGNKVLDFALEIEREVPDLAETEVEKVSVSPEIVNNVFHNTIIGDVGNVAQGSTNVTQETVTVLADDIPSLKSHLSSLGLQIQDIVDLERAIANDPRPASEAVFGPSVSSWVGKMVAKASAGIWRVSTSAAATLLSKALLKYYGLD